MSATELEGVMRRIRKLLAIANDERGNAAEAAAAAEQAKKIMDKFQIEHIDLVKAQLQEEGGIIRRPVFGNMKRDDPKRTNLYRTPLWANRLACSVGALNDCEVSMGFADAPNGKTWSAMIFHGYAPDVEVAVWMYDFIVGHLIRTTAQFQREWKNSNGCGPGKGESHLYRQGFVDAVVEKMRIDKMVRDEQRRKAAGEQGALVVLKKALIVQKFGDFKYRDSKPTDFSDKDENAEDLYDKGWQRGKDVDIKQRGLPGSAKGDGPLLLG